MLIRDKKILIISARPNDTDAQMKEMNDNQGLIGLSKEQIIKNNII